MEFIYYYHIFFEELLNNQTVFVPLTSIMTATGAPQKKKK